MASKEAHIKIRYKKSPAFLKTKRSPRSPWRKILKRTEDALPADVSKGGFTRKKNLDSQVIGQKLKSPTRSTIDASKKKSVALPDDIRQLLEERSAAKKEYLGVREVFDAEKSRYDELLGNYETLKVATRIMRKPKKHEDEQDLRFFRPIMELKNGKHSVQIEENLLENSISDPISHRNATFCLNRETQSYQCKSVIFDTIILRQKDKYLRLVERYDRLELEIISLSKLQQKIETLFDLCDCRALEKHSKTKVYNKFINRLYDLCIGDLMDHDISYKLKQILKELDLAVIREHPKRSDLNKKLKKVNKLLRVSNQYQNRLATQRRKKFLQKFTTTSKASRRAIRFAKEEATVKELQDGNLQCIVECCHKICDCLKCALKFHINSAN